MQCEIFNEFDVEKAESIFDKQRNRWTPQQARIINILSDPSNAVLKVKQMADLCGLSERYIYRLKSDAKFMEEVERRRKDDVTVKKLVNQLWHALFFDIEKYPRKIEIAMKALGELKEETANNTQVVQILDSYSKMAPAEVDERLGKIFERRKAVIDG